MGALAEFAGVPPGGDRSVVRSMYLDTVQPDDNPRLTPSPAKRKDDPLWFERTSTKGIDGAQSQSFSTMANRGTEARESLSKIWESEKYMHPTRLHPETTSRPELALNTADIPGAEPALAEFHRRARGTSPLAPQYAVPGHSSPGQPPPACRFTRDSMSVADIDKTSPLLSTRAREAFNALTAEDIEGATVGWKPSHRAHFNTAAGERNPLEVADINTTSGPRIGFRSPYPSGDVEGSQPRPLTVKRVEGELIDLSLTTADIPGAMTQKRADTVNDPWAGKITRQAFTETNRVADISGSAPVRSAKGRHSRDVAISKKRREDQIAATSAMSGVMTNPTTVKALAGKLASFDCDSSGRVATHEFHHALQTAGLDLSQQEVSSLEKGLADTVGFVQYRPFVQALAANAVPATPYGRGPSRTSSRPGGAQRSAPTSRPQTADTSPAAAPRSQTSRPATAHSGNAEAAEAPRSPRPADVFRSQSARAATSLGPHYCTTGQVAARTSHHAQQRAQALQSRGRTVSYKKAFTEDPKPKFWFSRMGMTRESSDINKFWRASNDPTMLGQNEGLMTAANELTGDRQAADSSDRTGSLGPPGATQPLGASRPHTAAAARTSRPTSAGRPSSARNRPQSAPRHKSSAGSASLQLPQPAPANGFAALGTGPVVGKTIMKAPTPYFRPQPKASFYSSGAAREAEHDRKDVQLVRDLM